MPKPIPATLRFDDAPDMINMQQLADMLGICYYRSVITRFWGTRSQAMLV